MTSLPVRYFASARSDAESSLILLDFVIMRDVQYLHKTVGMLAAFAVELYLKSWLSEDGYPQNELRNNTIRHNLRNLFELAVSRGYAPSHKSVLELIALFEHIHRNFETRYLAEDTEIPTLVPDLYAKAIRHLEADVRQKLGLPEAK